MKKGLYGLLFVLNIALILFFGWKVLGVLLEYREGSRSYEILTEEYVQEREKTQIPPVESDLHEETDAVPISVSFSELKAQCSDVVAWIYCEDSPIHYPVVQAEDNDYYLRRLLDGSWNLAGSLFMDFKNAEDFSDWNSIIYGHNMKNGSMLGSLLKYKQQEYYEEHPIWYLLTPDSNYKIQLLAAYTTTGDDPITYSIPVTVEERDILIEQAKQQSSFSANVEIGAQDKLIMFSTCVYDFDNARYVLLGVLKEMDTQMEGGK